MKKSQVKKNLNETFSFVERNKMGIIYTAVILGGLFVGYKVYKLVFGVFEKPEIKNKVTQNGEIRLDVNPSKATITEHQAKIFAQNLLDAMNVDEFFGSGTDEQAISDVFRKLKTADDVRMVYNAFGKKDYYADGSPRDSWMSKFVSYQAYDLVRWLREELSSWDGDAYKLVKSKLAMAGFTL